MEIPLNVLMDSVCTLTYRNIQNKLIIHLVDTLVIHGLGLFIHRYLKGLHLAMGKLQHIQTGVHSGVQGLPWGAMVMFMQIQAIPFK